MDMIFNVNITIYMGHRDNNARSFGTRWFNNAFNKYLVDIELIFIGHNVISSQTVASLLIYIVKYNKPPQTSKCRRAHAVIPESRTLSDQFGKIKILPCFLICCLCKQFSKNKLVCMSVV